MLQRASTVLEASQAQSPASASLEHKLVLKLIFLPSQSTNGFSEKGTSKGNDGDSCALSVT